MKYNYQVISVDTPNRVMEVRYEAEGFPPMNVSCRLPFVDEDLISVIRMYSPVAYWKQLVAEVQDVNVGEVGEVEEAESLEDISDSFEEVPAQISRLQARTILRQHGLLEAVETLLSDPTLDPTIQDAWNHASVFFRHSPIILSMATALELSDEQVDNMFIEASQVYY